MGAREERGPEKGPGRRSLFPEGGVPAANCPLSHPVPLLHWNVSGSTARQRAYWGLSICIIPKVKPHTEALGAGLPGGSRTHGNPDSGKGKETISCGKQSWQLGCIRGEGQGKVRGQRQPHCSQRHTVTDTRGHNFQRMPLRN